MFVFSIHASIFLVCIPCVKSEFDGINIVKGICKHYLYDRKLRSRIPGRICLFSVMVYRDIQLPAFSIWNDKKQRSRITGTCFIQKIYAPSSSLSKEEESPGIYFLNETSACVENAEVEYTYIPSVTVPIHLFLLTIHETHIFWNRFHFHIIYVHQ